MSAHVMDRVLFTVLTVVTLTSGYSNFRNYIPNGGQVPHPCKPNYLWRGVGHTNSLGGGPKNSFGADFLQSGKNWTTELCQKDSDGDGLTNGQELGDPNCVWTFGDLPGRISNISHPGVCDPWESAKCKAFNAWVKCEIEELDCLDELQADPDVKNITLKFLPTVVPNEVTSYFCMTFDLPDDDVYHIVAFQPAIDNAQVMHHILMYSCEDARQPPTIASPTKCGMEAGSGCNGILAGWTVGSPGRCLPRQAGYRFGKGLYSRVVMEFHWNNPERSSEYTDSSGLTLFYTRNLRPNNATTLVVGQVVLNIPPRLHSVPITGTCPASCSKQLITAPIYVTSVINHMHYLGKSEMVEVIRNGSREAYISNEREYNYDSPVFVDHDPPLQIRPGDDLKTTCVFNSQYRNHTVRYGEGTNDEMCYAFLTVYPAEALPYTKNCIGIGEGSICDHLGNDNDDEDDSEEDSSSNETESGWIDGCNWHEFSDTSSKTFRNVYGQLKTRCDPFGSCLPACRALIDGWKDQPCLQGSAFEKLKAVSVGSTEGLMMMAYVTSCPLTSCPRCQQCS